MDPTWSFAIILTLVSILLISNLAAPDLIALLGLVTITLLGFITPTEAFSGFSSSTVITLVAMFVVAAGLRTTGVTEFLAVVICNKIGNKPRLMVAAIMILGALLSAGMSNVATVALILPSVMLIAQRTGIAPAKLLMPLSFAVVLGGTVTPIGTATNLVLIDFMRANKLAPFEFLSFTPYGLAMVVASIVFVVCVGIYILPVRRTSYRKNRSAADFARLYNLADRVFSLKIPSGSLVTGLSLEQISFGTIFGAQVLAIRRGNRKILYPEPDTILYDEDILVVQGRQERIKALLLYAGVRVENVASQQLEILKNISCQRVKVAERQQFSEDLKTLSLKEDYQVTVVAIERAGREIVAHLGQQFILPNDVLQIVGRPENVQRLLSKQAFELISDDSFDSCARHLFLAVIPITSGLAGLSIKSARVGELAGVNVLAILRKEKIIMIESGDEQIDASDVLLASGDPDEINRLSILGSLNFESTEATYPNEIGTMTMAELALAPRSSAIGKTLVEMDFREKYAFQVMAIWHKGRPRRSNLANIRFQFGDALLVHGPREKLSVLKDESDFVFLSADDLPPLHLIRASFAIFAFAFITIATAANFVPIHLASVIGALFVILCGALKMEDVYREINWRIVFLVAAMLPFGQAFASSGLVTTISDLFAGTLNSYGYWPIVIALSLIASLISQLTDGVIAVLLVSPIALRLIQGINGDLNIALMAVVMSASIAFITPFSHKANLLVMGAGGYRSSDYARLGIPITILCFITLWVTLYFLM